MADYHTEEQQVEELKKWWKENGKSVIAGVVLGVGGLLAWKGWSYYQENHAKAASELYAQVQQATAQSEVKSVTQNTDRLRDDYASTPYASLAALDLAKIESEAGRLEGAADRLRWVLENCAQESLCNIAKIRLARVQIARKQYDQTLELLSGEIPPAYSSLVEEIRGDALRAKGNIERARQAYTRALMGARGNAEYLKMKRDDLGEVTDTDKS
mgnify:CR=1 FL=1